MIFILVPQGTSGNPLNPLRIYHLIRSSWHVDCPFRCAHRSVATCHLRQGHQQHAVSQIVFTRLDCFYTGLVPRFDRARSRADCRETGFAGRAGTSPVEFGRARLGIRHHGAPNGAG